MSIQIVFFCMEKNSLIYELVLLTVNTFLHNVREHLEKDFSFFLKCNGNNLQKEFTFFSGVKS